MLTSKQRAFLRSLAMNEDTILMIGKGGMSDAIIKQADDALTARELIKGKVLETAAEVVQVIGSKFVLFRRNPDEPKIELPKAKKTRR